MKLFNRVLAAGALAAAAATAAPVYAVPTVGTIPGGASNEFLGPTVVEGWYGASLYALGDLTMYVDYFGAEASYTNSFVVNNTAVFTHNGGNTFAAPLQTSGPISVSAGLINFRFLINGSPLVNGSNPGDLNDNLPNYFITFGDTLDTTLQDGTAAGGTTAWLFLDDGGAGPDDNHDDMVLRLRFRGGSTGINVPEPATLGMLGLGLAGLGLIRRRRPTA